MDANVYTRGMKAHNMRMNPRSTTYSMEEPDMDAYQSTYDMGEPDMDAYQSTYGMEEPDVDDYRPSYGMEEPNVDEYETNYGMEESNMDEYDSTYRMEEPKMGSYDSTYGMEERNMDAYDDSYDMDDLDMDPYGSEGPNDEDYSDMEEPNMDRKASDTVEFKKGRCLQCSMCCYFGPTKYDLISHYTTPVHKHLTIIDRKRRSLLRNVRSLDEAIAGCGESEPLIGLECIYQYAPSKKGIVLYGCKLCQSVHRLESAFLHIVSPKHRIMYLNRNNPELGINIDFSLNTPDDCEHLHSSAMMVEQTFGRKRINYMDSYYCQKTAIGEMIDPSIANERSRRYRRRKRLHELLAQCANSSATSTNSEEECPSLGNDIDNINNGSMYQGDDLTSRSYGEDGPALSNRDEEGASFQYGDQEGHSGPGNVLDRFSRRNRFPFIPPEEPGPQGGYRNNVSNTDFPDNRNLHFEADEGENYEDGEGVKDQSDYINVSNRVSKPDFKDHRLPSKFGFMFPSSSDDKKDTAKRDRYNDADEQRRNRDRSSRDQNVTSRERQHRQGDRDDGKHDRRTASRTDDRRGSEKRDRHNNGDDRRRSQDRLSRNNHRDQNVTFKDRQYRHGDDSKHDRRTSRDYRRSSEKQDGNRNADDRQRRNHDHNLASTDQQYRQGGRDNRQHPRTTLNRSFDPPGDRNVHSQGQMGGPENQYSEQESNVPEDFGDVDVRHWEGNYGSEDRPDPPYADAEGDAQSRGQNFSNFPGDQDIHENEDKHRKDKRRSSRSHGGPRVDRGDRPSTFEDRSLKFGDRASFRELKAAHKAGSLATNYSNEELGLDEESDTDVRSMDLSDEEDDGGFLFNQELFDFLKNVSIESEKDEDAIRKARDSLSIGLKSYVCRMKETLSPPERRGLDEIMKPCVEQEKPMESPQSPDADVPHRSQGLSSRPSKAKTPQSNLDLLGEILDAISSHNIRSTDWSSIAAMMAANQNQ